MGDLTPVPVLLCDLDDTLVDRAGFFAQWAARFAGPDAVVWLVEEDRCGFRGRDEFFTVVRDRLGLATPVGELIEAFYRDFLVLFRCEPDVRDALVAVRARGWRIAIVTNGSPSQEDKIRIAGLDQLVDAWCVSGIEGFRKPDPRLLELAAERCGETLDGAWLIGDAPGADIGAAHAAGLPSVWIRHGRPWPPGRFDYTPTHEADTFPEAVDLLPTGL